MTIRIACGKAQPLTAPYEPAPRAYLASPSTRIEPAQDKWRRGSMGRQVRVDWVQVDGWMARLGAAQVQIGTGTDRHGRAGRGDVLPSGCGGGGGVERERADRQVPVSRTGMDVSRWTEGGGVCACGSVRKSRRRLQVEGIAWNLFLILQ